MASGCQASHQLEVARIKYIFAVARGINLKRIRELHADAASASKCGTALLFARNHGPLAMKLLLRGNHIFAGAANGAVASLVKREGREKAISTKPK